MGIIKETLIGIALVIMIIQCIRMFIKSLISVFNEDGEDKVILYSIALLVYLQVIMNLIKQ